jgi:uncharacterized membrane protein YgcG
VRDTTPFYRLRRRGAGLAVVGLGAWLTLALAPPDEGWVIERFASQITIQPDGTFDTLEAIDVDFRGLSRRGIFRNLKYKFRYDDTNDREYEYTLGSVTAANGRRHQVLEQTDGAVRRIRIGDPNKTLSGKQTYRIAYRTAYGLNGFADHDELFWNAAGPWPVTMARTTAEVTAPPKAITRVACFQGPEGSKEACKATFSEKTATFTATRPLTENEQMTIVVGLRKGAVATPVPKLVARARTHPSASPAELGRMFFEPTHRNLTLMLAAFGAVVAALGTLWWRVGRDRQAVVLHQAGADAGPGARVPLFGATPIGVEFQPPDNIRPAQMGLLIDERADTLDVTATIIDLAVRGYLTITEVPKTWLLGTKDWRLTRLKAPDANLLDYERIVLDGLFATGTETALSELKNKFYKDLEEAKRALYKDAVARKWFPRNPNSVRAIARVAGILAMFAGIGVTIYLAQWGAGLVGLPFVAGGLLLAVIAGAMPRRTALGTHLMRRALGFAKYIRTGETHQQAFAERANLFIEYLPHAIVFKCVDKWAAAFKGLDMRQATGGWYTGATAFNASSFSSSVGSFSSTMSSAIASTPGGSGSSGFSGGGSSGGGGGGGGGGSW